MWSTPRRRTDYGGAHATYTSEPYADPGRNPLMRAVDKNLPPWRPTGEGHLRVSLDVHKHRANPASTRQSRLRLQPMVKPGCKSKHSPVHDHMHTMYARTASVESASQRSVSALLTGIVVDKPGKAYLVPSPCEPDASPTRGRECECRNLPMVALTDAVSCISRCMHNC